MKSSIPLTLAFVAIAAVATAHTGATGVVLERMHGMSEMENGLKSIGSVIRGQTPYDQDMVRATGATIQTHASKMVDLFVPGTDGGVSEARPEIWTDAARFAELAEELAILGEELAIVSSYEDARSLVARINFSCSACHDDFRTE